MISPLGQRQVFQTAHVEAVRQAQEVSEQIQRENAKKRVVDDRLQEDQASVRVIAESGTIQTHEREGGRGAQEQLLEQKAAKEEKDGEDPAESADSHLNFLA
jgi:hypothetical protein